jgi:single-strand DNA-binding protein
MSYQSLTIVGNLGRDPEMKYLSDGKAITNMSVAVTEVSSRNGEKKESTIWFRVAAWGNQAENCNNYLKKGSKVLVQGRLQSDDKGNPKVFKKQDGSFGAAFEMSADTVRFLTSKNGDGESSASGASVPAAVEEIDFG